LANVGVHTFIQEKLPYLQSQDTVNIVNVAGSSIEEYTEVVRILEHADGIDGYEVNISCPNVKEGGVAFGSNPKISATITNNLRAITKRSLIIKLTPNVTRISDVAIATADAGADGLSLINTLVGMAIDVQTRRPKLATVTGGLSGPAIKPVAIARVYAVAQAVNIPIIGIGGIMNVEDVLEFMLAGATAVQVGTANFIDPDVCMTIIRDLESYCEQNEVESISEVISSIQI
jgi:dihydroorotate dehydrogenase (NAD+) catalytic subunit